MYYFQAFSVGQVFEFKERVLHRLETLSTESGGDTLVMPVGLFLLVDEANGGDATAQELAARFNLLDAESRNVIDFYFLGWHKCPREKGICFSLEAFSEFRAALREAGVGRFGGNADLVLVDAALAPGGVSLDFSSAIRVDLSAGAAREDFPTLGGFLQGIVAAADELRAGAASAAGAESPVFTISDKLGLAMAKESLLDAFLDKLGAIIGAKKLAAVAVRDLGPKLSLDEL
jgi:hypothetical protein